MQPYYLHLLQPILSTTLQGIDSILLHNKLNMMGSLPSLLPHNDVDPNTSKYS
jgi:hypothetical protein